jgi:hypothetical protein
MRDVINCSNLRITQISFDVISDEALARATLAQACRFFLI